jgi:large subunit ribosomal protein L5
MASVLYEIYKNDVVPRLVKKNGYTNKLQIPRLTKIVINTGIGTEREKEVQQEAVRTLSTITGQKPMLTKTKKNISNFKLREGATVGCCVTLRGARMYDFLYRLVNIVLPRVRDFRGISPKGFDGAGNYTMGMKEQNVFPEIDPDKIKHTIGMNISVVTTARTDAEAKDLLAMLGMPFSN